MNEVRSIVCQMKKNVLNVLQSRIDNNNRKRLISKSRTIISNNCVGGYLYHNLGLKFESPTINLFIEPEDYLKMVLDIDKYFDPEAEITEVLGVKEYPVGRIYDCNVYFMHYKSFDEAVRKWRERCGRINKNSLYFTMTDREGCTVYHIRAFDALPYENKVFFSHVPIPEIKSAFYIKGFEKENCVGNLQEKMNMTGKRYLDQFDYVDFLNR